MVSRRIMLVVVLVWTLLAGCTSAGGAGEELPDGTSLVEASAESLRELNTVAFDFRVSGAIPGLTLRAVDGVAMRSGGEHGYARGDADVQQLTDRTLYQFVLSGDRLRLTDQDGDRTERPVPEQLSPARLLSPEHGLYQLLSHATNLKTETKEDLDDLPTYRVTGKLSREVVSAFIPGIQADVDVKFWVSEAADRNLMRVWVQVPPRQESAGSVMLELALSKHNEPVSTAASPTS
ncbi:LppX_LprAFG lipoprotein [Saccharomonospora sp. NPDC046836]|uniref:LppX_LprAFG lipoprotein n=1 Tax=Saccharomonospora sp. NPDC046836 TaxID=3156921 RepID=UPI00340A2DDE